MDDHLGMTWAAIVGDANLRDMRIGMTGGGTRPVKAASVAATDASAAIPVNTPANAVADGTEFTNAVNGSAWQGIPGTVFCAGSDCEVSSGGLLSGSWYFTPDLPMEPYVAADDGMGYLRETLYARFGHWLTVVAGSGETTVHAYASTAAMGKPRPGSTRGRSDGELGQLRGQGRGDVGAHDLRRSGRPDGDFFGRVHRRCQPDGAVRRFSDRERHRLGLRGRRRRRGLERRARGSGLSGSIEAGETRETGQAGAWTARAYGETDQRPAGILGGFNAHFTDGHAAGAYATRKQ